MAFLLRIVTNPKWVPPSWMPAGEVPADALTDLRANSNELSVWRVESDHSNLNTALAAAASNRERLDKLDYTLLDETLLPSMSIKCVRSDGKSPHAIANDSMHRDLVELTVQKVAQLAYEMMPLARKRVTQTEVRKLLTDELQKGTLNPQKMDSTLLRQLTPSPGAGP